MWVAGASQWWLTAARVGMTTAVAVGKLVQTATFKVRLGSLSQANPGGLTFRAEVVCESQAVCGFAACLQVHCSASVFLAAKGCVNIWQPEANRVFVESVRFNLI